MKVKSDRKFNCKKQTPTFFFYFVHLLIFLIKLLQVKYVFSASFLFSFLGDHLIIYKYFLIVSPENIPNFMIQMSILFLIYIQFKEYGCLILLLESKHLQFTVEYSLLLVLIFSFISMFLIFYHLLIQLFNNLFFSFSFLNLYYLFQWNC